MIVRRLFLGGLLAACAVAPADARFRWPWESVVRRKVRRRKRVRKDEPTSVPDCEQINEAVRVLEPKRLDRALKSSTKRQLEIIARCAKGGIL